MAEGVCSQGQRPVVPGYRSCVITISCDIEQINGIEK